MHTNMIIASTFRGAVPDRDSKNHASLELIPYLASTADITNPDRNSKMTGLKKAADTTTAALLGAIGSPGPGSRPDAKEELLPATPSTSSPPPPPMPVLLQFEKSEPFCAAAAVAAADAAAAAMEEAAHSRSNPALQWDAGNSWASTANSALCGTHTTL